MRGTVLAGDDTQADFPCTASDGIYEQQPQVVPLRFNDVTSEIPTGFETAVVEAVFRTYEYNPEDALANWDARLMVENVIIVESVANGDDGINGTI